MLVLGDGSNLLLAADFPGVMLQIVPARTVFEPRRNSVTRVSIDAGANWDSTVTRTLDAGCAGLENLALIRSCRRGTDQNIGAYGAEIDSVIESVEAFDRESGRRAR